MGGKSHKDFSPARDIPSLAGKVILITGANEGLGKQAALDLAKHQPAELWITGRNTNKGDAAVEEIKKAAPGVPVHFLKLELSSFAAIKTAAKTFLNSASRLDILICNAGLMAGPVEKSDDGYELRIAVNHLGHALLMNLLAPLMVQTASGTSTTADRPRIVNLSSAGHKWVPKEGISFDHLQKAVVPGQSPVQMYTQAKLAQLLYTRAFAKRYPQITSVSLHPGDIKTGLYSGSDGPWYFNLLIRPIYVAYFAGTIEDGAKNTLWCATSPEVVSGEYYEPVGKGNTASAFSKDQKLISRLEKWTDEALKGQYP